MAAPPLRDHSRCPLCPQCDRHMCCSLKVALESAPLGLPLVEIDLSQIDPPPREGDGTFCFFCGVVLRWTAKKTLRLASRAEIAAALLADADFALFHSILRDIHPRSGEPIVQYNE